MPIRIQCSNCSRTIKAKDSLAGQRVKCPTCQTVLQIPASPSPSVSAGDREARLYAADDALHDRLIQALGNDHFDEAASILRDFELWMVSTPGPETDEFQSLVAHLEGIDALVVFTSLEYVHAFADVAPEIADPDGGIRSIAVDGPTVFAELDEDIGLLVNPESDDGLLLDGECVQAIQDHLSDPDLPRPQVKVPVPSVEERDTKGDPRAVALRRKVLSKLNGMGFVPAEWMPLPELDRPLRPPEEIASRLLALAGVFAWASAPPDKVPNSQLKTFFKQSSLKRWVTAGEREILSLPRSRAHEEHGGMIGWRLENMWPLAWVLGFDRQPVVGAAQISEDVIHAMLFDFIGGLDASVDSLLQRSDMRSSTAVNSLEDYFYCAHNAVRTAQLDNSDRQTVPADFDPIQDGGAIHERRHALTWCLSPGVDWDETDLST